MYILLIVFYRFKEVARDRENLLLKENLNLYSLIFEWYQDSIAENVGDNSLK